MYSSKFWAAASWAAITLGRTVAMSRSTGISASLHAIGAVALALAACSSQANVHTTDGGAPDASSNRIDAPIAIDAASLPIDGSPVAIDAPVTVDDAHVSAIDAAGTSIDARANEIDADLSTVDAHASAVDAPNTLDAYVSVADAAVADAAVADAAVADAAVADASTPDAVPTVSYTITVPTGQALIANQVNIDGNTLDEVLPSVPTGTTLDVVDGPMESEATFTFFDTGDAPTGNAGWFDSDNNPSSFVFAPGGGLLITNNSGAPFDLTFTGSLPTPVLPLALPAAAYEVVSLQQPAVATIDDILGIPISTTLSQHNLFEVQFFDGTQYIVYEVRKTGLKFGWTPSAPPSVPVGSAVLIYSP